MLLAVLRVNESVPLFLVEKGIERRLGSLSGRKVAVLGLAFKADTDDERDSLAHKLVRLLERELADVAMHDPHVPTPTASFEQAIPHAADAVVVAADHAEFRDPRTRSRRSPRQATADCLGVDPWNCWCSGQVFAYASELATLGARAHEPSLGHGRRRHDRRGGRAAFARRPAVRGARLRPASGAAVDARGLRGPHGRPALAGGGRARDGRLHPRDPLAAIVGGIANFHRLPHTLTEVNNALYNAVVRAALDVGVERFTYVSPRWCSSVREVFPTPEDYLADCPTPVSAYGFSKLTGEVYCRAAHAEHGLPFTICRPFNAYGPGETPDAEPGIAHAVPDLIRKVLDGHAPARRSSAPANRPARCTHVDDIADGIVTATRSPHGLCPRISTSRRSESFRVAEIARAHLGGVRRGSGRV